MNVLISGMLILASIGLGVATVRYTQVNDCMSRYIASGNDVSDMAVEQALADCQKKAILGSE